MERIDTDIIVAGGGIAGLTAAAVFAADGHDVVCVEPQPPGPDRPSEAGADLRSTAFLTPSIALLEEAGLWDALAPHATDLRMMRLGDAGGADGALREVADFDAAALGQDRFGVNLPNWRIRATLRKAVSQLGSVRFIEGARVVRATLRTSGAILALSEGSQLRAPLVVAADGRDSFLREAAGIAVRRWDYGQMALVFAVSHPLPHDYVSTEIHRTGGPFTLVPLPDQDGVPHSAVVWMETGPKAGALATADVEDFEAALNARSCNVLGPLKLASPRAAWPIISQIADRLDGPRVALVAEAAHVMPPIGAQGLNTSLADLAALRDLLRGAIGQGGDIGAPALLRRYHRARHAEALARVLGVDALNRAAMAEAPMLRDLRRAGLRALHDITPLRQTAMRLGLGGVGPRAPHSTPM